jgi:predicted N-acyltransferase
MVDLSARIAPSIAEIADLWSSSAPVGATFVRHELLELLERTRCVAPERGWAPAHIVVEDGGAPVALLPAYAKGHSEGEFVFDWAWADAHERLGIPYYPKLLVGVPFTPATGPRVLTPPGVERARSLALAARALPALAEGLGVSSVHVNFLVEEEACAFTAEGFIERHGVQLHWERRGARTLDEFLARFDSKRRNQWRREVRRVAESGVTIRRLGAHELDAARMGFVHRCYRATVDAHMYGRPYLNLEFFEALAASALRERLVVLVAERAGDPIAMTFNVLGEGPRGRTLYGRYWGATEHVPFLHFVLGYAALVEEAIALGVDVIEPGAGGEHKQARGFDPALTRSVHWVREPRLRRVIAEHVARERTSIDAGRRALAARGPWKLAPHTETPPGADAAHTPHADTFVTEGDDD